MQRIKPFKIDLTEVVGRGDFRCPKCGVNISPDDRTEDVYAILEPVMNEQDLVEIIVQCNQCKSQIHLIGFHILSRIR